MATPKVIGNLFDIAKQVDTRQVFADHVSANQEAAKTLVGYMTGSGNNFATPVEYGDAASSGGYAVGSGNILIITRIRIIEIGSVTGAAYWAGVGDTDVGFSSSSAPTNATFGSTTPSMLKNQASGTFVADISLRLTVPATKYLYVGCNDAAKNCAFYLFGYEVSTSATSIS